MATIAVVKQRVGGGSKETIVDITGDTSYPTGGEVFTAADANMARIDYGIVSNKSVSGTVNHAAMYIAPTAAGFNLKSYNETPAETTSTNSLASNVFRCTLYGA